MTEVRKDAGLEIRQSVDTLVEEALELQWRRWPQLRASFTDEQIARMTEDTGYHIQFLAASLWADEPLLFSDYAIWTKKLFENLRLPIEWLTGSLQDIAEAIGSVLPEHSAAAREFITAGIGAIGDQQAEIPSYIDETQPIGALAARYLAAALKGDRAGAAQLIVDAADEGAAIRDLYIGVFVPVQMELGRLWHHGQISVAQEHYTTAVTQLAMSLLYPRLFRGVRGDHSILVACVGSELHELGARTVADFFEMEGWRSQFLGANTPTESIVSAAIAHDVDVIALSATMSFRIVDVADVIRALKADPRTGNAPVIVGGYPFNLTPALWRRVGADAYAASGEEAVSVAEALLGTG